MSHSAERKEKICLNCQSALHGRYCHQCGQENIEPRETVWGLINHFFSDITHFDGKFFITARYLMTRPGFLAKEFLAGRRARYLHPIRMYVFSSAIFFLILYSLFNFKGIDLGERAVKKDIAAARDSALKSAGTREDSLVINRSFDFAEKTRKVENGGIIYDSPDEGKKAGSAIGRNASIMEYDSVQRSLPPDQRDGWLSRTINHRIIVLNERYRDHRNEFVRELLETFMHSLSYMLFISLPLYALFLKVLYVRRKIYYVDHVLFLIYLYIYTFLILLIFFSFTKLNGSLNSGWINLLEFLLLSYGVYYAWRSMHKFYGQGRGKTLVKFVLFNIATGISVIILFTLFIIITVLRI